MLEDFLGSDKFRLGLKNFLEKYSYKNAVTQDLFDELSKVSDRLNISKVRNALTLLRCYCRVVDLSRRQIMNTWTRQKGYPVLTLTKTQQGDYRVIQERFLADPEASSADDDDKSEYDYRWEVPVTYVAGGGSKPMGERKLVWMHADGKALDM